MYQVWIHPELQVKNRSRLYKKKIGHHSNKLNPWKILLHQYRLMYIKLLSYGSYIFIKLKRDICMLETNVKNLTPKYTWIDTNIKSNIWSKSRSKWQTHYILLYTKFCKQNHQLHLTVWYTQYSTSQLNFFILTWLLHPTLENLTNNNPFRSKEDPSELQRFIFSWVTNNGIF